MLKITAVVSLMLIGSTLWAASLSCDSCGSECASACGTRHFRACCFNYLRRKRGPEALKAFPQQMHNNIKYEKPQKPSLPIFLLNSDSWPSVPSDFEPYVADDLHDNNRLMMFDV